LTITTLTFWNYQIIERRSAGGCWDGGIIEISTDGGSSWTQLESSTHAYDGLVQSGYSNPLAGLQAWCGEPRPWHRPVVDLDAYAGETVNFRFRLGTGQHGLAGKAGTSMMWPSMPARTHRPALTLPFLL
jgi:lysyl endopeptidase